MTTRDIADVATAHQIYLSRYSTGVVRRLIALLNRVDGDLAKELAAALVRLDEDTFTVQRLDAVLREVSELNERAYRAFETGLNDEMLTLVAYEGRFQVHLYSGVAANLATVVPDQVYAAAMSRPFQGRLLREWARDIGEDRMVRIRDALRIGFVEGETIGQMVRRIRGTRAARYADGLLDIDRRHAETIVRSAVSHMAGTTRDMFYEANSDILGELVWVSTLDGRTSQACRLRDQKRYTQEHRPVGHSVPWGAGPGRYHWNAVPKGSLVVTKRGAVPIESIAVGDEVLTHRGRFKPVRALLAKQCEGGVIRAIHTQSGRILRATDDHPVLTARGWKFAGALKLGDELLGDTEGPVEVARGARVIGSESKDRPAGLDDKGVALLRTAKLVAPDIDFKGDLQVWAGEVEDRAIDGVLGDPERIKRDECAKHHLLALAQMLLECGRDRLCECLAALFGHGLAEHAPSVLGVPAARTVALNRLGSYAGHVHRVALEHSARMSGVLGAGLLREAECPMTLSGRRGAPPQLEVDASLLGFVPNRESGDLGPFRESAVCEIASTLDGAQGLSLLDVLNKDELAVVGKRLRHDKVVALELQAYDSTVYDLEVQDDASYICTGIVVSNCRSSSIALLKGQKRLFGTRASANGQVDANETYGEWLARQPADVQDDILGAKRGRLFRDGGLRIEQFSDDKGRTLTIEQLAERDAAAFRRAGIAA